MKFLLIGLSKLIIRISNLHKFVNSNYLVILINFELNIKEELLSLIRIIIHLNALDFNSYKLIFCIK